MKKEHPKTNLNGMHPYSESHPMTGFHSVPRNHPKDAHPMLFMHP